MLLIIIVQTLHLTFCSTTWHVFNAIKTLYHSMYPLLQLKCCRRIVSIVVVICLRSREKIVTVFSTLLLVVDDFLFIYFFLWLAVTKNPELVLFTRTREEQSFSVCNIYERTKCLLDSSLSCCSHHHWLVRTRYIIIKRSTAMRAQSLVFVCLYAPVDADWFCSLFFISIQVTLKLLVSNPTLWFH